MLITRDTVERETPDNLAICSKVNDPIKIASFLVNAPKNTTDIQKNLILYGYSTLSYARK
ncbi:MAG: hypothetical protein Kow0063_21050 [Anaerolineae bacterium]